MKSLISFTLFLPLLWYLIIFAINRPLWTLNGNVSFLWMYNIDAIPVVLVISIFFSIYIIIVWLLLQFSNIFTQFKTKKLEGQVDKLKAELLDGQWSLVDQITKSFEEMFDVFKKESTDMMKTLRSENEKYITQTQYDIKAIKDKMEKWEKE